MPQYQLTPFKAPVQLAVAGTPSYLLGSYNDRTGPTLGFVISDSGNGTTSTVIFQIVSGNVPAVGSLVTIVGTANAAGAYNATNVSVASVAITEQGVCTITFAGSGNSASAQDFGSVQIPQPEVGETVSGSTYTSVPVARPYNNPETQSGQSITATLNLPTGGSLTGIVVVLQAANYDQDGEYKTIHTFAAVTGSGLSETFQSGSDETYVTATAAPGTVVAIYGAANLLNYRFYRFKFTTIGGTGLAIGKIEF